MAGDSWEALPYPIITDSGAAASVLPEKWCTPVDTMATEARRDGEHYTAASRGKIFNRRDKLVTVMSREGHMRNMRFTSCDVKRALGSVSAICKQSHTVVFSGLDHLDGWYVYPSKAVNEWSSCTRMACSYWTREWRPQRNRLSLFKGRDAELQETGLEPS